MGLFGWGRGRGGGGSEVRKITPEAPRLPDAQKAARGQFLAFELAEHPRRQDDAELNRLLSSIENMETDKRGNRDALAFAYAELVDRYGDLRVVDDTGAMVDPEAAARRYEDLDEQPGRVVQVDRTVQAETRAEQPQARVESDRLIPKSEFDPNEFEGLIQELRGAYEAAQAMDDRDTSAGTYGNLDRMKPLLDDLLNVLEDTYRLIANHRETIDFAQYLSELDGITQDMKRWTYNYNHSLESKGGSRDERVHLNQLFTARRSVTGQEDTPYLPGR